MSTNGRSTFQPSVPRSRTNSRLRARKTAQMRFSMIPARSRAQRMAGEVEEQVFEIRLPDPQAVQAVHLRGELPQALVDVGGRDLDDAARLDHPVLDAAERVTHVLHR